MWIQKYIFLEYSMIYIIRKISSGRRYNNIQLVLCVVKFSSSNSVEGLVAIPTIAAQLRHIKRIYNSRKWSILTEEPSSLLKQAHKKEKSSNKQVDLLFGLFIFTTWDKWFRDFKMLLKSKLWVWENTLYPARVFLLS